MKKAFDLIISMTFLLVVAPWLFLIIAIVIKADSAGPVFFIQNRSGKDGRVFRLIKFRTLVAGDHFLDKTGRYLEVLPSGPLVTKTGLFLRKTGFDEFPQFINVLKNEMSIVGPRPHPVAMDKELTKQIPQYKNRLLVKPGLIGWAQVNGHRGPAMAPQVMEKRLAYDLWYIKHQSPWLDLRILAATIKQLLANILIKK